MRLVQSGGDLDRQRYHFARMQRSFLHPVGEGLAFQILYDEVVEAILVPDIVEHANVGVVQR